MKVTLFISNQKTTGDVSSQSSQSNGCLRTTKGQVMLTFSRVRLSLTLSELRRWRMEVWLYEVKLRVTRWSLIPACSWENVCVQSTSFICLWRGWGWRGGIQESKMEGNPHAHRKDWGWGCCEAVNHARICFSLYLCRFGHEHQIRITAFNRVKTKKT